MIFRAAERDAAFQIMRALLIDEFGNFSRADKTDGFNIGMSADAFDNFPAAVATCTTRRQPAP